MLKFEKVSLRYGNGPYVLKNLSFELEPGSFLFVRGASGAGKSSLLKLLYMGQQPSEGKISLLGRDVSTLSRKERALMRRRIGVVFQDFRLLQHLTSFENVVLPLRIAGEDEKAAKTKVDELLSWVGLADCADQLPATLSGGQQQRLAIARAIVARPSLLLADEPTGNVDDEIGERLLYLFQELHRIGTTVLIATHNEALVERYRQPSLRLENSEMLLESGYW